MHRTVLIILFLLFFPAFSQAKEISYPTNQVERPLTLPDGVWELGVGTGYIQRDSTIYPHLSLRYGISDNLEFYPFGLKYRIWREDAPVEVIIKGRLVGFGYSTSSGTGQSSTTEIFLFTEIGVEGKQRVHKRFAILYRLEDYYSYYSKTRTSDSNDISISLGGIFSFTERVALEISGIYRRLYGFTSEDDRVLMLTTSIHYNISSIFDILFEAGFSDFTKKENLSSYPSESFRGAYVIKLNKRF